MGVCCLAVLGYIFLLSSDNVGLRYTGTILAACGVYPIIPLTLSWVSNNQLGHTKRGVAIAMTSMIAQSFSLLGVNVYRADTAPRYIQGHSICLAFLILSGCSAAILRYLLHRENKRRDDTYGIPETEDMSGLDINGVYDYHPQFRYAL
jgi:hypothetical protein